MLSLFLNSSTLNTLVSSCFPQKDHTWSVPWSYGPFSSLT